MGQFSFFMDSFLTVLNMSFTASFVIVGVILARLLMKKAPKVFSYALWGVVLLRLICPFAIESVLSLLPVNAKPIPPSIIYDAVPQIDSGIAVLDRAVNAALPPATPYASMNPIQGDVFIGTLLWVTVAAAMLLYAVISYLMLRYSLRCAMRVDANIYESEKVSSPFVVGILHPCIYLPLGINDDEYSYIVTHEQTHIRRLDHIVKIIAFGALCLHWFNPFCWLAFVLMTKDMEMSCDEAVIKRIGSGIRRDYSASLLALSGYRMLINGSPLAFGESGVKGRIKNIMNYRRPTVWVVAIAVVIAVVAAVGLMLSPKQSEPPVIVEPSSQASSSTQASQPEKVTVVYKPGEDYNELLRSKKDITHVVRQRVEEYRSGEQPDNPNHHPSYPANFPSVSQLPVVIVPEQFAVRDEGNPEAMGSVYIAIAIDNSHEMRMTISQWQDDDGEVKWGSGDTFFVAADNPSFNNWLLSDVSIHSDIKAMLYNRLTIDEFNSLTNMSFPVERIAAMTRKEIDFIFYMARATRNIDAEGFTTLDFTQLSSIDESAEHVWVQAGDSILGMTVKSVYVKGIPYGTYVQAILEEKTAFTGTVTIRGRFEQQGERIVFHVAKESQKLIPSSYPNSDAIYFINEQTARERTIQLANSETDCEITITDFQREVSNNSIIATEVNELGEIIDYTSDESKYVLVQSANIV